MPLSLGRLHLDLEWRITALTLVLLPAMVLLGFWQLDRAEEKRAVAQLFVERQQQGPQPLSAQLANRGSQALAYLPVRLQGRFVAGQYLLQDNRLWQGRFGYEVISLFQLAGGGFALVNRGWTAGDPARRSLPQVVTPDGEVALLGQLYVPLDAPYLLAPESLAVDDWPRVVQALEAERLAPVLADRLEAYVFPFSVRLQAGEPGALAVDWQVINVSPEKHLGYAVQWFTMAIVLLLIFVLRSSNLWSLVRPSAHAGNKPAP